MESNTGDTPEMDLNYAKWDRVVEEVSAQGVREDSESCRQKKSKRHLVSLSLPKLALPQIFRSPAVAHTRSRDPPRSPTSHLLSTKNNVGLGSFPAALHASFPLLTRVCLDYHTAMREETQKCGVRLSLQLLHPSVRARPPGSFSDTGSTPPCNTVARRQREREIGVSPHKMP